MTVTGLFPARGDSLINTKNKETISIGKERESYEVVEYLLFGAGILCH